MTSADLLLLLLRRWYILVVGLALTFGATYAYASAPGVYSTQADVVFLAPKSARYPNPIETTSESLIATAGLVARILDDGKSSASTASSSVSLTSEGITQGWSIRLPNSGGQWSNSFARPVLDVQVTGPTKAWVRSTLTTQIDRINQTLLDLQKDDGTASRTFIFTSSAPRLSTIAYSRGEPKRAIPAILLLGATLSGLAAIGFDRIAPTRRRIPPRSQREMVTV